jgi:hypothetical protein
MLRRQVYDELKAVYDRLFARELLAREEIRQSISCLHTVEITLDMDLRLEPLNEAHPEMIAWLTGPLVLFPIDSGDMQLTRHEWLSATH